MKKATEIMVLRTRQH